MATVNIKRVNGNVVFDPEPITLGSGDFVIWANQDPDPVNGQHWPTLKGQAREYWMSDSLPPAVEGQPAATSPSIAFGKKGDAEQKISYCCGLHSAEGGTIVIPKK